MKKRSEETQTLRWLS